MCGLIYGAQKAHIHACIGIQFRKYGMVYGARGVCCALGKCSMVDDFVSGLPFGLLSYMHYAEQA